VWIARFLLALSALGILAFGLIVLLVPTADPGYYRSIGVASIGMGLFGIVAICGPLRRATWLALWYLPLFWAAHLVLDLPPGKDHVHQVVFIVLSLAGLLMLAPEAFPRSTRPAAA
jgi:hypothetical protein